MTDLEFSDLSKIEENEKDSALSELERRVQKLVSEKNEDRFIFVITLVAIVDFWQFRYMNNWGSSVSILVIEVVILIILGRRLGVDDVSLWSEKLISMLGKN